MTLSKDSAYFQMLSCSGTCKIQRWNVGSYVDCTYFTNGNSYFVVSSTSTGTFRWFNSNGPTTGSPNAVTLGLFLVFYCYFNQLID